MLLYRLHVPKFDGNTTLALPLVAFQDRIVNEDSVQVLFPGHSPQELERLFTHRCVLSLSIPRALIPCISSHRKIEEQDELDYRTPSMASSALTDANSVRGDLESTRHTSALHN